MNPQGKIHLIALALLTAVSVGLIILATASLKIMYFNQKYKEF